MLNHLTVNDFALFEHAELDIGKGFTVITGETGAGKSMLVGALGLILGGRAETALVRPGATKADIIAEFDIKGLNEVKSWLKTENLQSDEEICLIRRSLDNEGRSRAIINGFPVTLQQLRDLGEHLVDIHGQHAHHKLIKPAMQRDLLDGYGQLTGLALKVQEAFHAWHKMADQLADAKLMRDELELKIQNLDENIRQLESVGLAKGEFFRLQNEHTMLSHAAELIETANAGEMLLNEHEMAILPQLHSLRHKISEMTHIDPALETIVRILDSAESELKEAGHDLRQYASRIDIDETLLEELDSRLGQTVQLARRHHVEPDALPDLLEEWREQRNKLEVQGNLEVLKTELDRLEQSYLILAEELSLKRRKAATSLAQKVTDSMQSLAMTGGRFEIMLTQTELPGPGGMEQISFEVASHAGEPARPLAKVASGGELSRISLAIAVAASQAAMVPTLVFDEVDVGIGGRVAEMVGRLMQTLGQSHQVLTVTHLPQVAARGNHHYRVEKHRNPGGPSVQIAILDSGARIDEIARMLGGIQITPTTLQHAREMLESMPSD